MTRHARLWPVAVPLACAALLVTADGRGRGGAGVPAMRFEEVGERAGARLDHRTRRFQGPHADVLRMFTSGGSAAAAGDFDNDGRIDLLVTDSDLGRPNRLLRNDGGWKFTDVAAAAGVAGGNDALSIVSDALWFDYDDDGWQDLLVARFGTPILCHNEHDGRFRDVTRGSGLEAFANTIAAIALDYDGDGRLDLLFGNYFQPVNLLDLETRKVLPNDLDNAVNGGGVTLYRSLGGGRFADVTRAAGLHRHTGWTLDVGHGDLDGDGRPDLYLACDYGQDRVYLNSGDGTFREVTDTAIGPDTRKGMNVDLGDYDRDGRLDAYVTNITDDYMKECNMLWHNEGGGRFTDLSRETGTCNTLWGWAAKFGDFDNDGWEDLLVADGLRSAGKENYIPILVDMITTPGIDFTDLGNWPPIGDMSWSGYQKKKLFRNLGDQAFREVAAAAGVDNDRDGRGLAVADFDDDGRLDFLQTNADQPSLLYRNATADAGSWVELSLVGTRSNRDAIGARAEIRLADALLVREVNGGNGYASQSMRRLHFGLGEWSGPVTVDIRWPSGLREKVQVPIGRVSTITEGKGLAIAPPGAARR